MGISRAVLRREIEPTHAWVVWVLSLMLPSVSLGGSLLLLAWESVSGLGMILGLLGVLAPLIIGFALAVRVDRAPLLVRLMWASLPWPIAAIQVVAFALVAVMTLGPPIPA